MIQSSPKDRKTQAESFARRARRGNHPREKGKACTSIGSELYAVETDAPPIHRTRGVSLWQGEIRRDARGWRVQDAWVRGIRPGAYRQAIRLVGAKQRRVMSPAQKTALQEARLASPLVPTRTVQDGVLPA